MSSNLNTPRGDICRSATTTDGLYGANPTSYDWASAWKEKLLRCGLKARLERAGTDPERFWELYRGWEEYHQRNGYPGRLLEVVLSWTKPDYDVLDIGAGSGAFALPIARSVRRVTAVEPSPGQLARLRQRIREQNARNISIVPKRWEDVSLDALPTHDLVLAVYCFQMADIREALHKMCRAARRRLVLVHSAGHDLVEPVQRLCGVEFGPDYVYLHNVLCQMGYRPDLEVLTRTYRVPLDLQLDILGHNPGLNSDQRHRLRAYLLETGPASLHEGEYWVERRHKDAVISIVNPA